MAKEFLGVGWKFPVSVTADGRIALAADETDIQEAIRIILQTAKGERVMRPDFGCGIHTLVFDSINTATLTLVENSVREALLVYEPRIELLGVKASAPRADEGELLIEIDYRVRATNSRANLVYPFYFREGGL